MENGIQSRINHVRVRASIYLLAIPVLLLYSLVLCGSISVSPGIPQIFLVKIQLAQGVENGRIQFGYFALCAENLNVSENLICMPSFSVSVDKLSSAFLGNVDDESKNKTTSKFVSLTSTTDAETSVHSLVSVALDLQRHIIISPFVAGGILSFAGLTTLLFIKFYQARGTTPERLESSERKLCWLIPTALAFVWFSTVIAFTGALLTTEAISSLRFITERDGGNLVITTGTLLGVLQWLVSAFSFLFALGVTAMLRSGRSNDDYPKASSAALGPSNGFTGAGNGPLGAGRGLPGAGAGPPGAGRGPPGARRAPPGNGS